MKIITNSVWRDANGTYTDELSTVSGDPSNLAYGPRSLHFKANATDYPTKCGYENDAASNLAADFCVIAGAKNLQDTDQWFRLRRVESSTSYLLYDPLPFSESNCLGIDNEDFVFDFIRHENLIVYSEWFAKSEWNKSNVSVTGNRTESDPFGGTEASEYTEDSATSTHATWDTVTSLSDATQYRGSIFVAKASQRHISLLLEGAAFSSDFWAHFDITNGVLADSYKIDRAWVEDWNSDWWRLHIEATSDGSGNATFHIYFADSPGTSNNTPQYAGDGASTVAVFGAQVSQADKSEHYVRTLGVATPAPGLVTDQERLWYGHDDTNPISLSPTKIYGIYFGEAFELDHPVGSIISQGPPGVLAGGIWYHTLETAELTYEGISAADLQTFERLYRIYDSPSFWWDEYGVMLPDKLWHAIAGRPKITTTFDDLYKVVFPIYRLRNYPEDLNSN